MGGSGSSPRGYRFFEWINRRVFLISIVTVVVALALGVVGPMVAAKGEPSFEPGGEIYDVDRLVVENFSVESSIRNVVFFVEVDGVPGQPTAQDHDVLTAAALREFKANSDAVRARYSSGDEAYLVSVFDNDIGVQIDGIYSIADAVDEALPGGLATATDADVKRALETLLADDAPTGLRFTLSRLSDRSPELIEGESVVVWRAPAFMAYVQYNIDLFEGAWVEALDSDTKLDAERWLRDVQRGLRGEASWMEASASSDETSVLGVAIDAALVFEEGSAEAAPYIIMAVAFILLIAGALLRSYWAAIIAAIGLGVVMMAYNGINALIGLKIESPLIVLIVPIALISFGVDFFIHGCGRAREMQVEGYSRERAYPLGATVLFTALVLAAASSVVAFLSNTVSGIQAITEFGIAAAVSIALSYLVLGLIAPRQLLALEEALGPRPQDEGLHLIRRIAFPFACMLAGAVVTLTIVMPSIGAPLFVVVILGLLFSLPFWLTRRRNRKAAAAGLPLTEEVKGAGHGFAAAGSIVHFLARWRVVTVPVVVVLAVVGVIGWTKVESSFEIKDFFNPNTDLVKSLDKVETHLGQSAAGPAYLYVEGDLTQPDALAALDDVVDALDDADQTGRIALIRDFDGELAYGQNAASLMHTVMSSPTAVEAIGATGTELTDADGNGLPDSSAQVAAAFAFIHENGIPGEGGVTLVRPDLVRSTLYLPGGGLPGTRVEVVVPNITDDANVLEVRALLNEQSASLETTLAALGPVGVVSPSGGAIMAQDSLASFTKSMITSLPIAIGLTLLLALLVMRSFRYAAITMVPILLVVAWVYGFMYLTGFKINPITATIAAIAIGVGIDYATHFTVRFRQEFRGEPSRFPALRRAGEGTGGALAISALTSITGFVVMALSPMPMFRMFGVLTAVMIFFALFVSLLVLPSLLILPFVTPSRKGEERAGLEEAITRGEFEYQPHARETADLRRSQTGVAETTEDDEPGEDDLEQGSDD